MDYTNLVKPAASKPVSGQVRNATVKEWGLPVGLIALLKDQLTVSSWLAVGAILQSLAVLYMGRVAMVPAFALIFYRILDAALMANGSRPNPWMDEVILNKAAIHFPDANGRYSGKPANREIVVFQIGARCNHPLGMFGPGFKELGEFFDKFCADIEARSEEYGLLGQTSYVVKGEHSTNSETMTVMFFENVEGLHKFAHDPLHREGWNWWNKNIAKMPHVSIWHEVFRSPAGHWEGIYVNSHPRGLGATTIPVTLAEDADGVKAGTKAFYSPIVDARRGLLKTSAGRMSASGSQATEHDKYEKDPYEDYGRLAAA